LILNKLIQYISDWIILVPVIVGALFYRNLNRDARFIFWISGIGLVPQMTHFFGKDSSFQNLLYNIYTPMEFGAFYLLFFSKLRRRSIKRIYRILLILFILLSLCLLVIGSFSWYKYNNLWTVVAQFFYILFIGLYIVETFDPENDDLDPRLPFFWYLMGIVLFAVSTTTVYGLWYKLLRSIVDSKLGMLWSLLNIFNIFMYALFSVGLLLNIKNEQHYRQ